MQFKSLCWYVSSLTNCCQYWNTKLMVTGCAMETILHSQCLRRILSRVWMTIDP
jgi:hypothetical protein